MSKLLFIIVYIVIICLLFSCSSSRTNHTYPDTQIQCTLLSYNYSAIATAELTAITNKNDTAYLLYGWRGIGRKKFWPQMKLTVQYNSYYYKIINGKKFYPSRIRINQ